MGPLPDPPPAPKQGQVYTVLMLPFEIPPDPVFVPGQRQNRGPVSLTLDPRNIPQSLQQALSTYSDKGAGKVQIIPTAMGYILVYEGTVSV